MPYSKCSRSSSTIHSVTQRPAADILHREDSCQSARSSILTMKGVRGIFRGKKEDEDEDPSEIPSEAVPEEEEGGWKLPVQRRANRRKQEGTAARPSYRVYNGDEGDDGEEGEEEVAESIMEESEAQESEAGSLPVSKHIEDSAGTNRLNRILSRHDKGLFGEDDDDPNRNFLFNKLPQGMSSLATQSVERIADPKNMEQVASFVSRAVIPPLKVDRHAMGGTQMDTYADALLQQETLLCFACQGFESTGDAVALTALQYPADYKDHRRSLGGMYGAGTGKGRHKLRYVMVVRSTNRPMVEAARATNKRQQQQQATQDDVSERGDYDAMFSPEGHESDLEVSVSMDSEDSPKKQSTKSVDMDDTAKPDAAPKAVTTADDEISSFPVLACMTLHGSGTSPDVRKLIRLDELTTVQDLHATVVQLAFRNGDTIRLDFATDHQHPVNRIQQHHKREDDMAEGSLDKERFIWSLFQLHAMLCVSVVERNAQYQETGDRTYLPPLSVRNLDRAQLQYVATVNGFLKQVPSLMTLLERHQEMVAQDSAKLGGGNNKGNELDPEQVDNMAYDLMMGNFASSITLFQSEEEKRDAEEVLNDEWADEKATDLSVAEELAMRLQFRMRDLEAETCRRLIAWEDEKQHSAISGKSAALSLEEDERESVDALALASLFKTLESLDQELLEMEVWLQERAAAIKPLTDDCADIEEENRQLEQQWKSYETLGNEIRRLLDGLDIEEGLERVLHNPAQALVYDDIGGVDIEESEAGVEQIFEAGKALQEAIEYPRKSGGLHLQPVSERARGLAKISANYCKNLAQIIVTVMEQFKTEVVAGSDHGKVSKSDTHAIIARKIRDTQRKFQSALLGYLKLIEILAALSPEMLPALRDAYSEMVSEGILMKKRMKGYFQALPGKNAAYMTRVGKDIKDYYEPVDGAIRYESVGAPDIKAALSELFPVIAREAYFTSALFGSSNKDQDGREKKRNFENAKKAVDHSSQNFRYYIYRTCGILNADKEDQKEHSIRGDPLLCLVASIYLNEVMDNYIDREKKGGDHSLSLAYVRATILDLRKKADKQWVLWVERQLEWIRSNDGVPVHGKRAGVFPSFQRFPLYLDHVLFCCREGRHPDYNPDMSGIKVINYYMQKMASALLDSLRDCAARDETDKTYAATVMQMENTYHMTQSLKDRGPAIENLFSKQILKANAICKESTDAYLGWMIKREFTILHELFSRVSKMRKDVGDSEVAKNIPKHQFIRTLTKEANRDILKEKIGSMYNRMEKHLSEDGKLLPVAWKALVKVLYEWFGRWEKMSSSIYRHKLDPTPVDVVRIAKAAGGGAKPKPQNTGSEFAFKSILALGANRDAQT